MADFSLRRQTIMALMKYSHVRWRCSASRGDALICLTTSGQSKNVVRALEEAKARKLKTIALLGRDGGSTIGMADIDLLVRSNSTARIQEAHQLLLHVLCEMIESHLV
jgi:D-sedoheptulose 7-phosphate isomerase